MRGSHCGPIAIRRRFAIFTDNRFSALNVNRKAVIQLTDSAITAESG
jgi:hypothetical protein